MNLTEMQQVDRPGMVSFLLRKTSETPQAHLHKTVDAEPCESVQGHLQKTVGVFKLIWKKECTT